MTNPMFGVIVSGRLVQTDFQPVDETKFFITIPDADNINHIVVFLTGAIPFQDGIGGSVYFSWPNPVAPPTWQFLGYISNQKPSAIFKITKLKTDHTAVNPFAPQPVSHVAQIGISVEPLLQIQSQIPVTDDNVNVSNFMEFATKMLENFFNFASSFVTNPATVALSPNEFIPITVFQQWYTNFQRRLQADPNFWK